MPYPLGDSILKLKAWGLLLTILIIAGMGFGAKNLQFTNNYRVFFSEQNPQLKDFDRFQEIYGIQDNILIAIEAKDGNVFTKQLLTQIYEFTEKAWETPYSKRVDSLANYQHSYAKGDELVVEYLIEEDTDLNPERLKEIRSIVMNDPILKSLLISDEGHVTAINITMNLPPDAGMEEAEAIAFVRKLTNGLEAANPNIKTYISGQTVLNAAFMEAAFADGMTLIPAMFLLISIVTYVFLRSFWGMVGTLIVVTLSIIVAFGGAGYLNITQSNATGMVPIIILTLGVADSIHLLITYFHEIRHGKSKRDAMLESLRINMQPIFLTSLTTVIGFLSLNFSEIPPFRDMGNMVAMGVIAAWLTSIITLPLFMMLVPAKSNSLKESVEYKIMDALNDFVVNNKNILLTSFVIALIGLAACIPRIEFNDLFAEYFDESMQFRQDNDFIMNNLTGVMALHYSVSSGEEDGIYKPEYLAQLDALSKWLETQDQVLHVDNIATIMKRLNKNLHEDKQDYYRIPNERELAAQYMFLYELSLPYGLDLGNSIDFTKSSTRLTAIIKNTKSKDVIALDAEVQTWVKENAPDLQLSHAVGPSIMFAHISERNLPSMVKGLVLAVVLISAVLLIALRNIKLGLLSLIPNLAPAVLAYGIWAVFVGELGMTGISITVITLGIIVDNTVHFLSKYLRARNEQNKSIPDALDYVFRTVGIALGVTTTILVLGFSVLALSKFHPNTVLGQLTAISLFISLMITYFVLPPLLFLVDSGDVETEGKNFTEKEHTEKDAA